MDFSIKLVLPNPLLVSKLSISFFVPGHDDKSNEGYYGFTIVIARRLASRRKKVFNCSSVNFFFMTGNVSSS